jgi:F0F1-type ATP synthase assembly protein I
MADRRQPAIWRSIKFLAPARSIKSLQANLSRGAPGILASYGLIGAVVTFGGLGYMLDRFVETAPWFLLAGLLFGVCFGFYILVKAARQP